MALTQRDYLMESLGQIYSKVWSYRQMYVLAMSELATALPPDLQHHLVKETLRDAHTIVFNYAPGIFNLSDQELHTLLDQIEEEKNQKHIQYLRALPYNEYLLTDHWQQKRIGALERAGSRCQVCNASKGLNVHHRTYEHRGYEHDEDLLVLCKSCHQLFHDNGKLEVVR